jgi:Uma2 family endonuclease
LTGRPDDGIVVPMDAGCYPHRVAPSPHRPASYEDLLAVPDHLVAEIIDDELFTSPRPAPRHAAATSALMGLLHGPFDLARTGPGGWRILFEPELHLGDDVLVPDIAAWRRERMPKLPDEPYFCTPPDWICEVQSPSTAALDRGRKLGVYARAAVHHAWMLDPIGETLEVLQLESGRWTILATHVEREVVNAEPFQALGLELTLLWEGRDPPRR